MIAALFQFLLKGLIESIVGVLLFPFQTFISVPFKEAAQVVYKGDDSRIKDFLQTFPRFFWPSAWLVGPSTQSIMYKTLKSNRAYARSFIKSSAGVFIALDVKDEPHLPSNAPVVVVCHGLGSDGRSSIIQGFTDEALRLGCRSIVYVRRGHSGTSLLPNKAPEGNVVYTCKKKPRERHALFPPHCDLDDMEDVTEAIGALYPSAPKVLVGFSAGSNLVVRYLGTSSHAKEYMCGISVSNGHNLVHLTKDLAQNRYISDQLLKGNLTQLFKANLADIKHLAKKHGIPLDVQAVFEAKTCRDFESAMLPLYGCSGMTVDEYYRENSSAFHFPFVPVPLLCLASRDDPLIDPSLADYALNGARENKNIVAVCTQRGGHQAWMETIGKSWAIEVMSIFLQKMLNIETQK